MINKDKKNEAKTQKSTIKTILSGLMVLFLSPIALATLVVVLCFILGLVPFLVIGFLIFKWFELRNLKHLRKMKLEYKLKSRFTL